MCKNGEETVTHMFIPCFFTQSVWRHLHKRIYLVDRWSGESLDSCMKIWLSKKSEMKEFSVIVCWEVWKMHSHFIFEGLKPSVFYTYRRIIGLFDGKHVLDDRKKNTTHSPPIFSTDCCR